MNINMESQADEDVLQDLALGKSMDYALWPALYPRLMNRLEQIVYNEFPIPKATSAKAEKQESPPLDSSMESQLSTIPNTQSTDKENDEPTPKPATADTADIADTDVLPKQLQSVYKSITSTLSNLFTEYPPHTVQRFAELILKPSEHYCTLPAYLHALDRVVHVTSGAQTFPLPPAVPSPSASKILSNGVAGVDPSIVSWSNTHDKPTMLGSDESLGGALLTPISWLTRASPRSGTNSPMEREVRTESTTMTDGPNGPGGVETVTISLNGVSSTPAPAPEAEDDSEAALRAEGGITQGELLRQEQRAGVVPAGQINRGDSDGMGEEDEPPHARGPEEIGMEDMGPQSSVGDRKGLGPHMQGIDIEAAVGRKIDDDIPDERVEDIEMENEDGQEVKVEGKADIKAESEEEASEPATPKREADDELVGADKRTKVEDGKEVVDMELVDADGKTEDEPKIGDKGETKGADAADTSST